MSAQRPRENQQPTVLVEQEGDDYVYTFHTRPNYQETLRITEGLRAILPEGLVNKKLGFAEKEIDPAQRNEGDKSTDIVLLIDANTPRSLVDRIFVYLTEQGFAAISVTNEKYPNLPESAVPVTRDEVRGHLKRVNEM